MFSEGHFFILLKSRCKSPASSIQSSFENLNRKGVLISDTENEAIQLRAISLVQTAMMFRSTESLCFSMTMSTEKSSPMIVSSKTTVLFLLMIFSSIIPSNASINSSVF